MKKRLQISLYVISDYLAASIAWWLFFNYRKHIVEASKHGYDIPINNDVKLLYGIFLLPLIWIALYAVTGFYKEIFRRSRLREFQNSFMVSVFGVLVIFFSLLLDDSVGNYKDYYVSLFTLFTLHFLFTFTGRLVISSRTISKIQTRKWGYKTMIVGSGEKAQKLYRELQTAKRSEGFYITGYLSGFETDVLSKEGLLNLGNWSHLPSLIREHQIEDVIICMEDKDHNKVPDIVDLVQNENIHLKLMPDNYGLILGMVKMNNILGAMLVEVDFEVMPQWQKTAKRIFDIFVSIAALILSMPILIVVAIAIKWDSKGPIFYKQERIGLKGKPFQIIKFRSMRQDAEASGPKLSAENDDRRTKVGIFLRKTRLDELPQFFNVLRGEMSIVGPRPERQFFIDQILVKAPYYLRLHRIKPGITSWGQVKFGYAENVDQMVERMKYDILYLENMSLGLDIKIMIYTGLIMFQGRGK
ncbi:MAG: sugar transferase [Bacteroidia bacterium]|nr:sugar transferase [Bacteroidia bacterium]